MFKKCTGLNKYTLGREKIFCKKQQNKDDNIHESEALKLKDKRT